MSYTGFFAETDLYEVAKDGDSEKGSWVVPVAGPTGSPPRTSSVSRTPRPVSSKPVLHRRGSFVYPARRPGASAVGVVLHAGGADPVHRRSGAGGAARPGRPAGPTAAEILDLTVCEPALGSGAFAIEAVRQLAAQYLERRQAELGDAIDPDDYPRELQKVKAYIALHNVYGVDLNSTAVELAEISLWLDTMVAGLDAPWFGLHLRRGNSLIGARRAVYSRSRSADKSWLTAVPRDVPLASLAEEPKNERSAPDSVAACTTSCCPPTGWGAAADAKEAAQLAPRMRRSGSRVAAAIKAQADRKTRSTALAELAQRVEALWQLAFGACRSPKHEIRRAIAVWGARRTAGRRAVNASRSSGARRRQRRLPAAAAGDGRLVRAVVLAADRRDHCGDRRRRVDPPTLDQWIAGLQAVLGRSPEAPATKGANDGRWRSVATIERGTTWIPPRRWSCHLPGPAPIDAAMADHPWLVVCERVAAQQGFFHWNLDFAPVFARGGFDLQVGNPPWVRPRSDVDALLAEGDPWWQLAVKPTRDARQAAKRREPCAPRRCATWSSTAPRISRRSPHSSVRFRSTHTCKVCSRTSTAASWNNWRHDQPAGSSV